VVQDILDLALVTQEVHRQVDQVTELLAVKEVRVRHLSSPDLSTIQWRESARDIQVDTREDSKEVLDNGDLDQAGGVLKAGPVVGEDLLVPGGHGLQVRP